MSESQTSSRASRSGSRRNATSINSMFPLLQAVNASYPNKLIVFGLGVEFVQVLSLVMNPHLTGHYVTNSILYAFQFPLWDGTFVPTISFQEFIGIYWAMSAMIIAVFVAAVVGLRMTHFISTVVMKRGLNHVVNALTSVLQIPMLQLLLTPLSCQEKTDANAPNTIKKVSWLFPQEECYSGLHMPHYVTSIILLIIFVFLSYIVAACCFHSQTFSSALKSRPHSIVERFVLFYRVALCASFHLLLPRGMASTYTCVVLIASLCMALLHAMALPFHRQSINRATTSIYCVTAMAAATSLIQEKKSSDIFIQQGGYYAVLAIVGTISAIFGKYLADFRLNSQTRMLLNASVQSGFVPEEENPFAQACLSGDPDTLPFPRGLPTSDYIFSPFKYVEGDIVDEMLRAEAEAEDEEYDGAGDVEGMMRKYVDRVQVVSPYITNAHFFFDGEIATRFLTQWRYITGKPPSPHMISFACRIYTKFHMLFPKEPVSSIDYVRFLCSFAPSLSRMNTSVQLLDSLHQEMYCSLSDLFEIYTTGLSVKEVLGVRDKSHQMLYRKARHAHKQTLIQAASIWRSLEEDDKNVVSLCYLTNGLSDMRNTALQLYLQAANVATDDEMLFRSFSNFLTNVLRNDGCAQLCLDEADIIATRRRARLSRHAKAGDTGGRSSSGLGSMARSSHAGSSVATEATGAGTSASLIIRSIVETIEQQMQSFQSNLQASMLSFTSICVLILLVAIVIAEGAMILSLSTQRELLVARLHSVGREQSVSQRIGYNLHLLRDELPTTRTSRTVQSAAVAARLSTLRALVHEFESHHNFLTHGEGRPTTQSLVRLLEEPQDVFRIFTDNQTSTYSSVNFWEMGNRFTNLVLRIIDYTDHVPPPTGSQLEHNEFYLSTMWNVPRVVTSQITLFSDELLAVDSDYSEQSQLVQGISLTVAIVLLAAVLYVFVWSFRRAASAKVEALRLFHLIPRDSVRRLASDAKLQVEKFVAGENLEREGGESSAIVSDAVSIGGASGAAAASTAAPAGGDASFQSDRPLSPETGDPFEDENQRRRSSYTSKLLTHLLDKGDVKDDEDEDETGGRENGTAQDQQGGPGGMFIAEGIVPVLGSGDNKAHDAVLSSRNSVVSSKHEEMGSVSQLSLLSADQKKKPKRTSVVRGGASSSRRSTIMSGSGGDEEQDGENQGLFSEAMDYEDGEGGDGGHTSSLTAPPTGGVSGGVSMRSFIIFIISLVVVAIAFAFALSMLNANGTIMKLIDKSLEEGKCGIRLKRSLDEVVRDAEIFSFTGNYERDYKRFGTSRRAFLATKDACLRISSRSILSLGEEDFRSYYTALDRIEEITMAATSLMANAVNLSATQALEVTGFKYSAPKRTFTEQERYAEAGINTVAEWFTHTNHTHDLQLSFDEQRTLARSILFDEFFSAELTSFEDKTDKVEEAFQAAAEEAVGQLMTSAGVNLGVSLAFFCLLLVTVLVFTVQYSGDRLVTVTSIILMVVCVVAVGVGGSALVESRHYGEEVLLTRQRGKLFSHPRAYLLVLQHQVRAAVFHAYNGDILGDNMDDFFQLLDQEKRDSEELDVIGMNQEQNEDFIGHLDEYLRRKARFLRSIKISVQLVLSVKTDASDFKDTDEFRFASWDVLQEEDDEENRLSYPDDIPLLYQNDTYDLALPPHERIRLAFTSMTTQRVTIRGINAERALDELIDLMEGFLGIHVDDAKERWESRLTGYFICASMALLAFLAFLVSLAAVSIKSFSETPLENELYDSLYAKLSTRAGAALFVIAIGFCLVGVLGIVFAREADDVREAQAVGNRRLWGVGNALMFAHNVVDVDSGAQLDESRRFLLQATSASRTAWEQSVFKNERVMSLWKPKAESLFGSQSLFSVRDLRSTGVGSSDRCFEYENPNIGGNMAPAMLQYLQFFDLLDRLAKLPYTNFVNPPQGALLPDSLLLEANKRADVLEGKLSVIMDDTETAIHSFHSARRLALIMVLLLTLLIIFLSFSFVFWPTVRQLSVHETGTKLLLILLPDDIRNTVPEIADYYEGDSGTKDDQLKKKLQQSEKLLQNILPPVISRRLKNGETCIADTHPCVTVVFAALIGFDEYSPRMEAREIVHFLNALIVTFDHITDLLDLEKIKTIGDIYFLCGGLTKKTSKDHALRCMECAILFQEALTEHNVRHNTPNLTLRIGINTDPAVAGVIGSTKVAYDLWGDSVNTASRMQSTGTPGNIQVSDSTFQVIKEFFAFEDRKVAAKGKGELTTHMFTNRTKPSPFKGINWRLAR